MDLDYPDHLNYFESHEYALLDDNLVTVGITAYAVEKLGDIVFLNLPEVGSEVSRGEPFGAVESDRTIQELISPVSGIVQAINESLKTSSDRLMDDPYEEGWLIKVEIDDPSELEDGMTSEDYSDTFDPE